MSRPPNLRTLLRANAAFAAITGSMAVLATGPVARMLGVAQHRLVSATGAGLLLFAVGLVVTSGAPPARLVPAARRISLADATWVIASGVIILASDLRPQGDGAIAVVAAIVAAFAVLQLLAASAIDDLEANQVVEVSKVLEGTVDQVWPAVIDHEAYGRLAPNLSRVLPTGPDGPELTRRCWDTRGRQWDERCVLWQEGERFAVEVDTAADDYPYPLAYLRGEWAVTPAGPALAEVAVRFELRPCPGPAGAAFAAAMTTGARPILRRVLRGWQEMVSGAGSAGPGTEVGHRRSTERR